MNGSILATGEALWQAGYMRIRHLKHSTYQHQYHIVWGTKYRRKFLKEYVKPILLESLYDTVEKYQTRIYIEAANVDNDHVHLQIEISPHTSVAVVIQTLKQYSSIHLKQQFRFIREMYPDGNVWSVGYFSSTIGVNEAFIRRYIAQQGQKDFPEQSGYTQTGLEFS